MFIITPGNVYSMLRKQLCVFKFFENISLFANIFNSTEISELHWSYAIY
jgi:hypothetical protein